MKRRDIEDFCRQLEKGLDCSEYASKLYMAFPEGDVLCLKCRDVPIFVANMDGTDQGFEYCCHFVYVCDGVVYDILHNNIGIDIKRYIERLGKMNRESIMADAKHSTCIFGLPEA